MTIIEVAPLIINPAIELIDHIEAYHIPIKIYCSPRVNVIKLSVVVGYVERLANFVLRSKIS